MRTIEERRLGFLEDTVRYYSENVSRRALDKNGQCKYKTEDGRKCAIGRYIINDEMCEALDCSTANTVHSIFKYNSNFLPKNIIDLGSMFLSEIQKLHDVNFHWNLKGLTKSGKEKVKEIEKEFCK